MKKNETKPSGITNMLDTLYGGGEQQAEVTDVTTLGTTEIPLEEEDNNKDPEETKVDPEDNNAGESGKVDLNDDDSVIPEDVLNNQTKEDPIEKPEEDEEDDDLTDEQITEAQQVSALFDAVGESLGWNMADIKDEDKPLTVDDLTKYLGNVVKENSVPQYADERIQQLDEYVKNGGDFETFYTKQQEALSLDNLDMEDESNQKAVIREMLKYNGYNDKQINSKIQRYEDSDMLMEESEDALERLKEIRTKELEENTRQQEELAKQQEEQSKQFFTTVTNDINSLDNIRGIAIPKEDRKALYDYIFKIDENGLSQYQKDFNKNMSKNLIESAYFTMKADTLISGAKKTGETSAAEKLRKILRHQSKNHSTYNADDKRKKATDLISGMF